MGVLTVGEPLSWEESLTKLAYVREHGVLQFIRHWQKYKEVEKNIFFYGDEIEYGLFKLDHEARKAYLSLRGAEVRSLLEEREAQERFGPVAGKCTWHPEYGSWMVESTPAEPYSGFTADLRRVETNMRARRARLLAALDEDEIAPTVVVFPMLGVDDSAGPDFGVGGPAAESEMIPDAVINPHPRFATLTRNIRTRRGSKVKIEVPLYQDEKTRGRTVEMDAMAFGMGCCCLQVTFQCRDIAESRHVYDQLAVIAPIMLALTAATPIARGKLLDTDVRWKIIEDSVDDRTPAERGSGGGGSATTTSSTKEGGSGAEEGNDQYLAAKGKRRIQTSRYSGVSSYICPHKQRCDLHCAARHYNDIDVEVDEATKATLEKAGVDALLTRHVAHLFVRDPLVMFSGLVEEVDDDQTDHFENIQSTNWNSVRWKPPPSPNPAEIGWRVELRTMEVQLTDYENAAFCVFVVLLLRVLLSFDLNVYMPMSKVHENMEKAHERDAATKPGLFWWRSHLAYPKHATECVAAKNGEDCAVHSSYDRLERMSILEILTGKQGYYPGLVPLVLAYLQHIKCDPETERIVRSYLDLIVKRASGELVTAAKWMRRYVEDHVDYDNDSTVKANVAYDLLSACHDVGVGKLYVPELLGVEPIAPIVKENAYNVQLKHLRWEEKEESEEEKYNTLQRILERYAERARLLDRKESILRSLSARKDEIRDLEAELTTIELELEPTNVSGTHVSPRNNGELNGSGASSDAGFNHLGARSAGTLDAAPRHNSASDLQQQNSSGNSQIAYKARKLFGSPVRGHSN
mmetsp:Transcript_32634/g.104069  ORF Transcript_32634/g.104069 Transcript_32634/m.104069 type:complete len:803 (+) Transcript_32634:151-2559(+)|eukprot:CAMPEP_0118894276 /NCGR_PEP_ID=MMETSP1166-20130328/3120_1 /TAXON_ID=1104430 /ORGANISM="Chrysoreinhardia sp, Strain CCMP3193" /LENGTH=802 /DNA_ID=CAMNT_0006833165 /DNA_START=135 /DNA_END=2543 /DNA_ORIENTATION=-